MFEVIDISPGNLGSSLCFIQSGISHNALVSHDVLCRVTIYSLMYSFLNFEPVVVPWLVLTSFMTCIQASQEAGKVVWYSQLFKNVPQFVVIHTVKAFTIVNEAEVGVFLEFPCFLHNPTNAGNLISCSSALS